LSHFFDFFTAEFGHFLFLNFRGVFWKKSCHFRRKDQGQEIDLEFLEIYLGQKNFLEI